MSAAAPPQAPGRAASGPTEDKSQVGVGGPRAVLQEEAVSQGFSSRAFGGGWGAVGPAVPGSPALPRPRPGQAVPSLHASPSWGHQEASGTSWAWPGPAQPGRSGCRSDEGAACRYMKNCTEIWGLTSRPNMQRQAGPAPGACSELLPSALPPCPAPCCWEGSAVASWPVCPPRQTPFICQAQHRGPPPPGGLL